MKYCHHGHHGEGGNGSGALPVELDELEKARLLLHYMLDHNRHHEEDLAALAERLAAAGKPEAAKKIRAARARMVEANLALMEAEDLAAPKEV